MKHLVDKDTYPHQKVKELLEKERQAGICPVCRLEANRHTAGCIHLGNQQPVEVSIRRDI